MKTRILFALLLSASVWIGCDKARHMSDVALNKGDKKTNCEKPKDGDNDGGSNDNSSADCKDVVCTANFVMIYLRVADASGAPVALDAFYTEDMSGAKLPADLYEYDPHTQTYMVFNDSWVAGHQNSTAHVRFVGFKNGTKVVSEDYTINTDCCHVSKASGNDSVIVP